jgi:hypothetical protein
MRDPSVLSLATMSDTWALALAACQNQVWADDNSNVETYMFFF